MYKEISRKVPVIAVALLAVFVLSGCSKSENKNEESQNLTQEVLSENVESTTNEVSKVSEPEDLKSENTSEADSLAVVNNASNDNTKKENDSDKKKKEDKDDKKKDEDDDEKIKPEPCFSVSGKNYSGNTFYFGGLKLNAGCSKEAREYQWYINGNSAGAGKTYNFQYKTLNPRFKVNVKNPIEIKLIATSKDGLTASETKTITFREIPTPDVCFNQESSEVKSFKLGEEYAFDASCSDFSDENPITKYTWKFRDGGQDDSIEKDGIKVKHTFTKPTTTASGGGCNYGLLSVDLIIETKIGGGITHSHSYCIEK